MGTSEQGRRVLIAGAGYVGLTTGACLASLGHRVVCADIDVARVEMLRQGRVPILEPGLPDLVRSGISGGRLTFTTDSRAAATVAEVVFLCLPTPMGAGGAADLTAIDSALGRIRDVLPAGCVVVNKSTVPVGTAVRVAELIGRPDVAVVSNPEFLREGSAVEDFLEPDRIVVGAERRAAGERVAELYERLDAPVLLTDPASAELIKYATNCFLAMKLSYVNAIAELCERLGANVDDVTGSMGRDPRIGASYLRPGPGWGGSCLPKDVRAMERVADAAGFPFPLLHATIDMNSRQRERVVAKLAGVLGGSLSGRRIGLLGLTFKAGTDDLRDSPALAVAELLLAEGARVTGYDPAVSTPGRLGGVTVAADPYEVAAGAAALVLLTDWPEFAALDWRRVAHALHGTTVIDTRNQLDGERLRRAGLHWYGPGSPAAPASPRRRETGDLAA